MKPLANLFTVRSTRLRALTTLRQLQVTETGSTNGVARWANPKTPLDSTKLTAARRAAVPNMAVRAVATTAILLGSVTSTALAGAPGSNPALNDPTAIFDSGAFSLPDLNDAKDSYLIVITPEPSGEAIKLTLPAGVTGLRIKDKALPPGAWKWSYKVSRGHPPTLAIITSAELKLTARDIPETGKYPLAWKPVAGAKSYALSGKTFTTDRPTEPPTEGKVEGSCFDELCARGGVAIFGLELKPGTKVAWQVSALDAYGIVLAKSAEANVEVEQTMIQKAIGKGFSVQRSDTLSTATAKLPATVSYQSAQEEGKPGTSSYQSQFAILYQAREPWGDFDPRASLEAHLTSTGASKAADALVLRAGATRVVFANPGRAEGTEWVTNLKYETERKQGTKKGLLEFAFTPVYGPLGTYWPNTRSWDANSVTGAPPRQQSIQIAPTIVLGAEVGKTFSVGSSEEKKDTVIRFRTNMRLDMALGGLSSALGTRSASAYVDGTYWFLPREDGRKNFRLGTAGLSFGLTDYLSFDLAYSAGRDAPTFIFNRSTTAGLGLKF